MSKFFKNLFLPASPKPPKRAHHVFLNRTSTAARPLHHHRPNPRAITAQTLRYTGPHFQLHSANCPNPTRLLLNFSPRQDLCFMNSRSKIPRPTVKRLSLYLRELENLTERQQQTISSKQLAAALGLTDAQVRKDLGYFGQFGHPGIGS